LAPDSEIGDPSPEDPNQRFIDERPPDKRSDAERDRDRVLYSAQFARLAEITQVISPERGYVFHNRLTHSLKVGQIARRIAQRISEDVKEKGEGLRDLPDVVEAAALAHDLGHPPFGHAAEVELNKLVQDAGLKDGFEGNAQSFRILTRLAASDAVTLNNPGKDDEYEESISGLNWTRQCLDSVLKYPWGHGENAKYPGKWGFYETEREIFQWVRQGSLAVRRSLGAEIIDWADDITYAIHDMLDFFRSGNIPFDRLRKGSGEYLEFLNGMLGREPSWKPFKKEYEDALADLISNFPFRPSRRFTDSSQDHMRLHQFATGLIRPLVDSIKYVQNAAPTERTVLIDPLAKRQVDLLKQFTWHYIILNRDLSILQAGQRKAIRTVFRKLLLAARRGDFQMFPDAVKHEFRTNDIKRLLSGDEPNRVRGVADYIAGLTEKEVMRVFRTIEGTA
jgi:dGTPase